MSLKRCNITSTHLLDIWFETRHWGKVYSESNILEDPHHVYIAHWKRKIIICKVTMVLSACLRTWRRICLCWQHYNVLPKHRKKNCWNIQNQIQLKQFVNVPSISFKSILKWREEEYQGKRKINWNRDKIGELVNPRNSQKKREEILVQEGDAF